MDAAYHWPQGIGFVIPMEGSNPMLDRRPKPHRDRILNCPRCNSTDTKFCYFNNYSFSQPRYFCKSCRRYWTQGGSLRNVPVGGGSRKNKKSSSSSSSSSLTGFSMNLADLNTPPNFPDHHSFPNPKIYGDQDLNLAYPPTEINYTTTISNPIDNTPFASENKRQHYQNTISLSSSSTELLKTTTGATTSGGFSSFMAMPPTANNTTAILYPSGFHLQEPKQALNFSLDGFQNGYGNNLQGSSGSNGARLLFPVEDIKPQVSSTTNDFQQHRGQGESSGYWTRLLSGGSW